MPSCSREYTLSHKSHSVLFPYFRTPKVKVSESGSVASNSLRPHGLYSPCNSPGKNTGVGSCSLLQGIFPTQESNGGLLHCSRILYQLSYQGSPQNPKHPLKHSLMPRKTPWCLLLEVLLLTERLLWGPAPFEARVTAPSTKVTCDLKGSSLGLAHMGLDSQCLWIYLLLLHGSFVKCRQ